MITVQTIAAISVIIFVASMVRGFTGFGLVLVAVPLLHFFMPVKDTAVFITIVNFIFSVIYFGRTRKALKKQPLGAMALFTVIGVATGTLILKFVSPEYVQLACGILILVIVYFLTRGMNFKIKSEKSALKLSGIFGGILAGLTGITGPPVAIILASINTPKEKFNAIISVFILFAVSYALFFYLLTGLIRKDIVILGLCSVPALVGGLVAGDSLVKHISQKLFTNIVYAVLIIMGTITVFRALSDLFPGLF